jgi:hypothetical protein
MATFDEVVQEVVVSTKRADKLSLIRKCINDAVARLSTYHKFKYDLQYLEYSIPVPDQANLIHLIPYSSIPRYRAADAIQGASDYDPLKQVQAANATIRGVARKGTYYESGLGIHASLCYPTDIIKISYWDKPARITVGTTETWHFEHAFYIITGLATAYVFRDAGETDEYDRLLAIALRDMEDFRRDTGGM